MNKIMVPKYIDVPKDYTGVAYIKETNTYATYSGGYYHSFNDEPAVVEDDDGLRIIQHYWYKEGKLHRVGKPAFIEYADKKERRREYYVNGVILKYGTIEYWKACWECRTPENEQMLMAKLLAGNINVG